MLHCEHEIIIYFPLASNPTRREGPHMKIETEMLKLPTLKHVGLALVEFVCSLEKGTFVEKTTDWVYEPSKAVAFGFPKGG